MAQYKSMIRVRMSAKDAHYGGNLVDGAHMLHLFGDVATELLILRDGDEGLFKAYDMVEFIAPVYAGDFIEATGEIVSEGNPPARWCSRPARSSHRVRTFPIQRLTCSKSPWSSAVPAERV